MNKIKFALLGILTGVLVTCAGYAVTKNATPPESYDIYINNVKYNTNYFNIVQEDDNKILTFQDNYGRQIEVSLNRVTEIKEVK